MGLDNVVSLKNGTSGWVLAGFEIERGNRRVRLDPPSAESVAVAERHARRIAREDGVELVDCEALGKLLAEAERSTVYCIDVRTRDEYLRGHIPGFTWFPGGQAIQRSDDAVPIPDAVVVFCCDHVARAAITASWFRRLGYPNVSAVDGGVEAWRASGGTLESGDPFDAPRGFDEIARQQQRVSSNELALELSAVSPPTVVFVGTSREFAEGHVPGSIWISRSWLDIKIADVCPDKQTRLVLTDLDSINAAMGVHDLGRIGFANCAVLDGGIRAWAKTGLSLEYGLTNVMTPPEDVLPTIPNRSYENMMNYLRWEEALGHKYHR